MDRLGLFLFYDSEGIVDDYVTYMLEDMMKNLSHLCILVNGDLTSEGRKAFEKFTDHILVRSNRGFDVGAWKDAMIDEFGFEKLEEFDEVILFNDSFFGPVYPFKEMFDEILVFAICSAISVFISHLFFYRRYCKFAKIISNEKFFKIKWMHIKSQVF